jgi:alcohol dehydrogenase (NADP+)
MMASKFQLASDAVDPQIVPQRTLYTGAEIPAIGLGTFGSDAVDAQTVAKAVYDAAHVGYRHFDCASVYGNEREIGISFQQLFGEGLKRDDIWVTSKLWNDKHVETDVIPSCEQSLKDLHLDYLDLYLIHWPFPNYHPPGCDIHSRSLNAKPYLHENYMKTWRQLEKLVERRLVRHIGTSNMTIPKLELLLRDAEIKPAANEMELHPHFQQPELFNYVVSNNIVPIGYSPLGSPGRPERDRTPQDTVDIEDLVIENIAERRGIHPAEVCLKWAVQRGQIPIPFSTKRKNFLNNLKCAATQPLSNEEMRLIETIDKNCRLIKGQVFLWKPGQNWEDLWDINGRITPA